MGPDFLPLRKGPRELFIVGAWYSDKDPVKAQEYLRIYLSACDVRARDPSLDLRYEGKAKELLERLSGV